MYQLIPIGPKKIEYIGNTSCFSQFLAGQAGCRPLNFLNLVYQNSRVKVPKATANSSLCQTKEFYAASIVIKMDSLLMLMSCHSHSDILPYSTSNFHSASHRPKLFRSSYRSRQSSREYMSLYRTQFRLRAECLMLSGKSLLGPLYNTVNGYWSLSSQTTWLEP